jgi:DNA-binding beta-propeller fold protein YncE
LYLTLHSWFFHNQAVPVSTLAGSGAIGSSNGIGVLATFNYPSDAAISRSGAFAVVVESFGRRVRMIDLVASQVTTLAGSGLDASADGQGTQASFSSPQGVAISPDCSFVLVTEASASIARVRHISIATGVVTTLAGNWTGYADGVGTFAAFNNLNGIALSPDGTYALILDFWNHRVRRLDMVSKTVTTVAGSTMGFADGIGSNAKFRAMLKLAIDPTGSYALICAYDDHRIRRLDIASAQVTTLAGSASGASGFQDGMGTNAIFNWPFGVAIDPTGTYALIAESLNRRIRRIVIATAQVSTVAGTGNKSAVDGIGAHATFNDPCSISIDANGTFALVADLGIHSIRRIALASTPCTGGYYCPAGSSSPTANACPAGFYCPAGSSSASQFSCALGFFCPSGSSAQVPCPAMTFYCPAGASAPVSFACAAGYDFHRLDQRSYIAAA